MKIVATNQVITNTSVIEYNDKYYIRTEKNFDNIRCNIEWNILNSDDSFVGDAMEKELETEFQLCIRSNKINNITQLIVHKPS